jgi:hypothetical protein
LAVESESIQLTEVIIELKDIFELAKERKKGQRRMD